jgi:hypothetical protein
MLHGLRAERVPPLFLELGFGAGGVQTDELASPPIARMLVLALDHKEEKAPERQDTMSADRTHEPQHPVHSSFETWCGRNNRGRVAP